MKQAKDKLEATELKLQQSLPKSEALPNLEAELRQRLEALSRVRSEFSIYIYLYILDGPKKVTPTCFC